MSRSPTSILDAVLSPFERAAEIIFGILMALSVTAAYEITAGKDIDTRELMIAALGCNLAWGLIDGAIYLLQQQFERYRNHRMMLDLRGTGEEEFRERVLGALPPRFADAVTPDTLARFRREVDTYQGKRPHLWSKQDLAVAGIICLLCFMSTLPLVVPFMLIDNAWVAMRVSHVVAIAFLFWLGWGIGRWSGASALASGSVFAVLGTALAVMCIALGG